MTRQLHDTDATAERADRGRSQTVGDYARVIGTVFAFCILVVLAMALVAFFAFEVVPR